MQCSQCENKVGMIPTNSTFTGRLSSEARGIGTMEVITWSKDKSVHQPTEIRGYGTFAYAFVSETLFRQKLRTVHDLSISPRPPHRE